MAKISRKSKNDQTSAGIDEINQFILEGLREAGLVTAAEQTSHTPNVDVFSTPAELVMEIEMPGVRREDIEVTLLKDTVTVRSIKAECFEEPKVNYVCMERSFGRIFRQVEIPFAVDAAKIKAVYKNGVLTITLPRVVDKRAASRRVTVDIA
ncbi:MAG: Hsp20/alpha crystallin family protein [Deltaproteobacteria bacterium]|nr:Hsp20/alpha crystallin family protein [Deltaproteobacteria bacterium]